MVNWRWVNETFNCAERNQTEMPFCDILSHHVKHLLWQILKWPWIGWALSKPAQRKQQHKTACSVTLHTHCKSERAGQKDVLFDAMGYEANCSVVCQNKQKQWKLQTPTISTQYMRSISKSGLNSILVPYKENKDLNDMHQINFKQG